MELEYDKEIDALLRKTAKDGAAAAPVLDSHPDADEISMFAENALPETARPRIISHIADCDRCRTILSNVIVLNADADASMETVVAPAPQSARVEAAGGSWLSGLFTTKKLAFGFGTLALLFAGFLGFSVVRNLNSGDTQLARADSNEMKAPAENIQTELNSNSAAENAKAGSDAVLDEDQKSDSMQESRESIMVPQKGAVTGKETARRQTIPSDEGFADRSDLGRLRDNKPRAEKDAELQDDRTVDMASESEIQPSRPAPVVADAAKAAPRKSVITPRSGVSTTRSLPPPKQAERVKEKKSEDRDGAVALGNTADKNAAGRKIGGKTFTRRNGIWYDSAYKNQATRKITRGTSEFESLDAGVRSIADKLSGTVVVVWKTKALKIQ